MNATIAILLLTLAATLPAQTTVAVPCMRDNTLYEDATGSLSNGAGNRVFVGVTGGGMKRRGLVRFDVAAAVPAGAHVIGAVLTVNIATSPTMAITSVFGHRLIQDWGEGTSSASGAGAPATPGDATWLHTFHPSQMWAFAGGTFAPAASLMMATPPSGPVNSTVNAIANADVQSWLDNPGTNFGWLLKTDELVSLVTRQIESREASPGTPPVLRVTYITPGQSTPWGRGCLVNGQPFTLGMTGTPTGGTTVQLNQSQGPAGGLAANFASFTYDQTGLPMLPQCSLYLMLGPVITHSVLTLDNNGNGSRSLSLPIGFPGLLVAWQSAALDNSPAGFVLSNALVWLMQ